MTCRSTDIVDETGKSIGTAIVCSRGERRRKCKTCGEPANLLCDYELKGDRKGKTCDAAICRRCAVEVGKDRHLCPTHDRWVRGMANAPDPAKLEETKRNVAEAWLLDVQRAELNEVDHDALDALFPDWENDWHVVPEASRATSGEIENGRPLTDEYVDAIASLTGLKSATRTWAEDVKAENAKRRGELEPIAAKVAHVKRAGQTRDHRCHWPQCNRQVPPAMWGCRDHWYTLPKYLRDKIWQTYRSGQEATMSPSRSYVDAAREVEAWIIANYFPNEHPDPWANADDEPSEQEILGDVGDR